MLTLVNTTTTNVVCIYKIHEINFIITANLRIYWETISTKGV